MTETGTKKTHTHTAKEDDDDGENGGESSWQSPSIDRTRKGDGTQGGPDLCSRMQTQVQLHMRQQECRGAPRLYEGTATLGVDPLEAFLFHPLQEKLANVRHQSKPYFLTMLMTQSEVMNSATIIAVNPYTDVKMLFSV
jgi:hypothetical protein